MVYNSKSVNHRDRFLWYFYVSGQIAPAPYRPLKEYFVKHLRFSLLPQMVTYLLPALLALPLTVSGCSNDTHSELSAAKKEMNTSAVPAAPPAIFAVKTTMIKNAPQTEIKAPKIKYNSGEDPEFAKRHGWPVRCPSPLPGSILPQKRIAVPDFLKERPVRDDSSNPGDPHLVMMVVEIAELDAWIGGDLSGLVIAA